MFGISQCSGHISAGTCPHCPPLEWLCTTGGCPGFALVPELCWGHILPFVGALQAAGPNLLWHRATCAGCPCHLPGEGGCCPPPAHRAGDSRREGAWLPRSIEGAGSWQEEKEGMGAAPTLINPGVLFGGVPRCTPFPPGGCSVTLPAALMSLWAKVAHSQGTSLCWRGVPRVAAPEPVRRWGWRWL